MSLADRFAGVSPVSSRKVAHCSREPITGDLSVAEGRESFEESVVANSDRGCAEIGVQRDLIEISSQAPPCREHQQPIQRFNCHLHRGGGRIQVPPRSATAGSILIAREAG